MGHGRRPTLLRRLKKNRAGITVGVLGAGAAVGSVHAFGAGPAALGALLLGAGIALGYVAALWPILWAVRRAHRYGRLGYALDMYDPHDLARAYHDPERALRELADYSFFPPPAPAPFVGCVAEPGRWGNAHVNDAHMRGERRPVVPKPAGAFRVFLTGSSSVWSAGASADDRTAGDRLERALRERTRAPVEVLSFASPGWSSTHQRIAIENRISEWEPDLVISLSGIIDAHVGVRGLDPLWFRTPGERYHLRWLQRLRRRLLLPKYPDVNAGTGERRTAERAAKGWEKNVRLATLALGMAGARYMVAEYPIMLFSRKPLTPSERTMRRVQEPDEPYFRAFRDAFAARMRGLDLDGFDYVDLTGVFDDYTERDQIYIDHYHVGDIGYERIGARLADALVARGLVPAPAENGRFACEYEPGSHGSI